MKPKAFHIEAFTITQTAKKLGYRSTKTLYRLLNRDVLEDYIYLEKSGRVYLMLEPPNLPNLSDKIKLIFKLEREILSNRPLCKAI